MLSMNMELYQENRILRLMIFKMIIGEIIVKKMGGATRLYGKKGLELISGGCLKDENT